MQPLPGVTTDLAELGESFSILSRYGSRGMGDLVMVPNPEPVGIRIYVQVDPEDVTRRDRRRLEELGWSASATMEKAFDRLYLITP